MSKTKNCPVCDQPIKLENLEKHIKKVHPRARVDVDYSEKEEKRLKEHEQRQKELTKPTGLGKYLVVVLIVIIVVAAAVIILSGPSTPEEYEDFTVIDTQGNSVTLSNWEGEVILVDFMQTTCGACQSNTQSTLVPIHDEFGGQIKMLSVSIRDADTNSDLVTFKGDYGATWQYALDTSGVQALYGVTHTPTSYLIDRDGKIVYSHVGTEDYATLKSEIQSIL
jgi:cytochrome oxidase Cu insertion factor (SCO1/SenC/PrrC family)